MRKISLCFDKKTETGEIGYSIPHLAKLYVKQNIELRDKQSYIERYETYVNEKKLLLDGGMSNEQIFNSAKAKKHGEKIAVTQALKAFSLSSYDYDSAIRIMSELISKNPKFSYLRLIKGRIENQSGFQDSYNIAKKEFQIAIELDPENIDALIDLGYLEQKRRSFKKNRYIELVSNSIRYFEKALKIAPMNQRANLGYALSLFAKAKSLSWRFDKMKKYALGREINTHFERAYYSGNLSNTQRHSNAITSYNFALNNKILFRDWLKVVEICNVGLKYEPHNRKIIDLRYEAESKINPNSWKERMKDKGWKITHTN